MIMGSYPCCDGPLMIEMPAKSPVYFKEACPHCGATVWHRLSRINSESYTEPEFLRTHEVDETTKQIRYLNPASDAVLDAVLINLVNKSDARFDSEINIIWRVTKQS